MVDVAVIGMGPWGLAVLERLVSGAIDQGGGRPPLTVHAVEPGTPGAGVFGGNEPDHLILNTPCGEHSMYPFPEWSTGRAASGFFEWAVARGYTWVGDRCAVTPAGRPISPHDFLPRRLMGEYLAWFYRRLVAEAPPGVRVVHHETTAVDVTPVGRRERVHLANGAVLEVDHVVMTTGHTPNQQTTTPSTLAPYPMGRLQEAVEAGSSVAVSGMGLVAIDVVTALTAGRDGRFFRRRGRLVYEPSGNEPRVALFSRTGRPFCAQSSATADPTGSYRPLVFTPEAVAELRGAADGRPRRIDARDELVPLVLAEMTIRFYAQSALVAEGPDAAAAVAEDLAAAWRAGRYLAAVGRLAARFGPFHAAAQLLPEDDDPLLRSRRAFVDAKDYQAHVTDLVERDTTEALVAHGASPVKQAHEVLRALRDTLRAAVEFGGLTADSHRWFHDRVRPQIARLIAGPPVRRSEELLALVDADVVRLPFGPSPAVLHTSRGAVVVSRFLDHPYAERFDHLVLGHLEEPTIHRSASPLLRRLYDRGRIRQLQLDGEEVGSVDLTDDFHPRDADGRVQRPLWLFGALAEGVRYDTAYLPSPAGRVRAFVDAGVCADQILGCRT